MPSFSVGFAQVETRLRAIRRRLNLLALQDALYLNGSLLVLAGGLLIVLALRARGSLFGFAAWAAVGAMAAAILAAGMRLRRRWLSTEQVVRMADRQAGLEDRLSTLLLGTSQSPLRGFLLDQILASAPRWDVDRLAPRRVPRSVYVFVGSLLALIPGIFFSRPPADAIPPAAVRPQANAEDEAVRLPQPADAAHDGGDRGRPGAKAGAGPGGGQTQIETGAHRDSPASVGSAAAGDRSALGRATEPGAEKSHGVGSADSSDHTTNEQPPGVSEKLRSAIRDALGADPTERGERAGSSDGTTSERGEAKARPMPGGPANPNSASAQQQSPAASAQASSAGAQLGRGGAAPAAGARTGEEPTELFGESSGSRDFAHESPNLSIKLGAFAAMSPGQAEPPGETPPIGSASIGGSSQTTAPVVTDEQSPDAPLQKAEVAPVYEALVRQIFTRDE